MSTTLAIYRLPAARAAPIGHVRVVMDRNQKIYIQGSRLEATSPSGDFLILTLLNEQVYYVKTTDYEIATKPKPPTPKHPRRRKPDSKK